MFFHILTTLVLLGTSPEVSETLDSLYFTPYQDPRPEIVAHIDQSKSDILVAAYGFNDPMITDALIKASKRGVKVSLVVDSSQASLANQKKALAALAGYAYIHIGQSSEHQIMHSKFVVFDEKIVEFGSFNYSTRAPRQDNFALVVNDKEIASRFADNWRRIDSDMPVEHHKKKKAEKI